MDLELSSSSPRGAGGDHTAELALNRDATTTLEVVLEPPGGRARPTEWLLLHAIPVTASLTTVLCRLLALVEQVPPATAGRVAMVRVGYVVSEIHSYCLLLQCTGAAFAAGLKAALEHGAELLQATPVQFVDGSDAALRFYPQGEGGPARERRLPLLDAVRSAAAAGGPPRPLSLPSTRRGTATPLTVSPSVAAAAPTTRPASSEASPLSTPLLAPAAPPPYAPSEEACPICLVEPLAAHPTVTTLCSHTYHLGCYAQLASPECPLCRFSLYNLLSDVRCADCGTYEDLWACLVCGHIGCGRGRRNHQRAHCDATGHSCSLQTSTNRVWNDRARMFLNQVVALMLGELDDSERRPSGTEAALRSDALWLETDAGDAALRAVLTASKEEAVRRYYDDALRDIRAEQREWFQRQIDSLVAAVAAQRAARGAAAPPPSDGAAEGDDAPSEARERQLLRAEAAARGALVERYVEQTRGIVASATGGVHARVRALRRRQEELREAALLASHHRNGLKSAIDALQHRTEEASRKGQADIAAKEAEQRALERQVEELLHSLA